MLNIEKKKILVIAAHPDDEVIGVGGTIHKLVKEHKCEAHCLILGEGLTARGPSNNREAWTEQLNHHRQNTLKSSVILGYKTSEALNFPDNRFDSVTLLDIVKVIEKKCEEILPDIIFTHHGSDLNIDHRITCEAVLTANRPQPHEQRRSILTFETLSSTEWQAPLASQAFLPNIYIEINKDNLDSKIKALEAYDTEIKKYPHPRSTKGLTITAQRWGLNVGVNYAEGFRLLRTII